MKIHRDSNLKEFSLVGKTDRCISQRVHYTMPCAAIEVCTKCRSNTEEGGKTAWGDHVEYHRMVHISKFLKDEQGFAK